MRPQFVISEIWIGFRRNVAMTIALIVTVAIAMTLGGTGLMIWKQVDRSKTYWYGKVEVSIYFCNKTSSNPTCNKTPATQQQKDELRTRLAGMKNLVAKVHYETEAQAYQRAKERFANTPDFAQTIRQGDIPDSLRVKLKKPSEYGKVEAAVKGAPGVGSVINERDALKKVFNILKGLRNAGLALALILTFAAVLLVANTIRMSAYNRRRETGIMRLVGASNLSIQMPFILEGVLAGLIGSVFSVLLLVVAKWRVVDSLQNSLNFSGQVDWADVVQVSIIATCFSILVCGLASYLTLLRYLRV